MAKHLNSRATPAPWTARGSPPLSAWGGLPPGARFPAPMGYSASAAVGKPTGGKRWQATRSPKSKGNVSLRNVIHPDPGILPRCIEHAGWRKVGGGGGGDRLQHAWNPVREIRGKFTADEGVVGGKLAGNHHFQQPSGARRHERRILSQGVFDEIRPAVLIIISKGIGEQGNAIARAWIATRSDTGPPVGGELVIGIGLRGNEHETWAKTIRGSRPGVFVGISEVLDLLSQGINESDLLSTVGEHFAVEKLRCIDDESGPGLQGGAIGEIVIDTQGERAVGQIDFLRADVHPAATDCCGTFSRYPVCIGL